MSSHSRRNAFNSNDEYVTTASFLGLSAIVLPTLFLPEKLGHFLDWLNGVVIAMFGFWFIWVLAFATILCVVLAAWPRIGNLKLGRADDKPEYSYLSWISMLYGAGASAALLKWSVAEPMHYLNDNPDVIKGIVTIGTNDNFRVAMKWAFLHWGMSAWSCYAITGLALAFLCYRKGKPLSIGTALSTLTRNKESIAFASTINVMVIMIGMLVLLQAINFGIELATSNLIWMGFDSNLTFMEPSVLVAIATIVVVCVLSVACARSGLKRGTTWVSVANVVLSTVLLLSLLAASSFIGLRVLIICLIDYLVALPHMAIETWFGNNQPSSLPSKLENWQRHWSLFHWTWWIPFSVFVGLFMARISKGRTVREFVVGAMVVPSLACIIWFSWAGGTAMILDTTGTHAVEFASAANANKLLVMIEHLFTPTQAKLLYVLVITLIGTYLITTVSSALLVFDSLSNTVRTQNRHSRSKIKIWGLLLIATSLAVNNLGASSAIQSLMCLSALPASILIASLCGSFVSSVISENRDMETIDQSYLELRH